MWESSAPSAMVKEHVVALTRTFSDRGPDADGLRLDPSDERMGCALASVRSTTDGRRCSTGESAPECEIAGCTLYYGAKRRVALRYVVVHLDRLTCLDYFTMWRPLSLKRL